MSCFSFSAITVREYGFTAVLSVISFSFAISSRKRYSPIDEVCSKTVCAFETLGSKQEAVIRRQQRKENIFFTRVKVSFLFLSKALRSLIAEVAGTERS